MSNILLIGKDFPDSLDFAEGLAQGGNLIFTSQKSEDDNSRFESEGIFTTNWNKSSSISAHSLIIKAETKFTNTDNIIFYFDSSYFCNQFELDKTEEVTEATDNMITAYLYSAGEALKRINQRKEKITVTFLLREYPSKTDILLNPKGQNVLPASSIVNIAQQAFIALAENFATNVNDNDYLSVILAKCNISNELYKNEKAIARWCVDSFKTVSNLKNKQTVKHAANWNKVGAKISAGFILFR